MPEYPPLSYKSSSGLANKLYRPNRYEFSIPKLPPMFRTGADLAKSLNFSAESVFFPSRNIGSEPIKIAGPVDEIPYESVYSGDLNIGMRVYADFNTRMVFETWMNSVVNLQTQNLNYPNNYRCEAFVTALDTNDKKIYEVKITDVWPKSIGMVSVGHALDNSIATMQLALAFRRYYVVYYDQAWMSGDFFLSNENGRFFRDAIETSRMQGLETNDPYIAFGEMERARQAEKEAIQQQFADPNSVYNMGGDFNPDFLNVDDSQTMTWDAISRSQQEQEAGGDFNPDFANPYRGDEYSQRPRDF